MMAGVNPTSVDEKMAAAVAAAMATAEQEKTADIAKAVAEAVAKVEQEKVEAVAKAEQEKVEAVAKAEQEKVEAVAKAEQETGDALRTVRVLRYGLMLRNRCAVVHRRYMQARF
jgi:hypothetical protein